MRRWAAVGLAAVVLVSLGLALLPDATSAVAEGARVVVAKGPALARYDARADATHVVFRCDLWTCERAMILAGDARGRVDASHIVLRAPEGAWRVVDIEPFDAGSRGRSGAATVVNEAYAGPFAVEPVWWRLAPLLGGILLAAVSFGDYASTRGWARPVPTAVAGAAALAITLPLLVEPELHPMIALLGWGFVFLLAVSFTPLSRARAVAVPIAAAAIVGIATVVVALQYFPVGHTV